VQYEDDEFFEPELRNEVIEQTIMEEMPFCKITLLQLLIHFNYYYYYFFLTLAVASFKFSLNLTNQVTFCFPIKKTLQ
jgi:hypothetical protein